MTTSLTSSSPSALQRASQPIPQTPVAQEGSSPSVQKPRLDFERPPEGKALSGSPHYRGQSLSVSDLGSLPLDIVAGYLPADEHGGVVTAEPAFKAAQLMSGGLAAQDKIAASKNQIHDANNQICGAAVRINRFRFRQSAFCTGVFAVVGGAGAATFLAQGNPGVIGIAGFVAAGGGATALGCAALCIKNALTWRHENNRLVAGEQALVAAKRDLKLELEKASEIEAQIRRVDEARPTSDEVVVIRIAESPADSDPLPPLNGSSA